MIRNKPAFIATAALAFLAVGFAIFALWQLNNDDGQYAASFQPDENQEVEMQQASDRLIKGNYEILELYYLRGLPKLPEPYGYEPEDGIYKADSDKYETLNDIEQFVDSIFISDVAEKIKNNPAGAGPVYKDKDGKLGISVNFTPNEAYPISWEVFTAKLIPISENECKINLTLKKNTIDGNIDQNFETFMVKEDEKWLLTEMIYQ